MPIKIWNTFLSGYQSPILRGHELGASKQASNARSRYRGPPLVRVLGHAVLYDLLVVQEARKEQRSGESSRGEGGVDHSNVGGIEDPGSRLAIGNSRGRHLTRRGCRWAHRTRVNKVSASISIWSRYAPIKSDVTAAR